MWDCHWINDWVNYRDSNGHVRQELNTWSFWSFMSIKFNSNCRHWKQRLLTSVWSCLHWMHKPKPQGSGEAAALSCQMLSKQPQGLTTPGRRKHSDCPKSWWLIRVKQKNLLPLGQCPSTEPGLLPCLGNRSSRGLPFCKPLFSFYFFHAFF